MPSFAEPVPFWFILATVGLIFAVIFIAIYIIRRKKEQM